MKCKTFINLFLTFILISILGNYYEEILNFLFNHNWEIRHTVLYGPFNPIYGFGCILIIVILYYYKRTNNFFKNWFYSGLLLGIYEYLISYILEVIFKINFWNYSNMFSNINGRTTILYMIGWGFSGALILKIYPKIINLFAKIPSIIKNIIVLVTLVFMTYNIIFTYYTIYKVNIKNEEVRDYINKEIINKNNLFKKIPIMEKAKKIVLKT